MRWSILQHPLDCSCLCSLHFTSPESWQRELVYLRVPRLSRTPSSRSLGSCIGPPKSCYCANRCYRVLRRVLVRKVPLLPSAGHAWLVVFYLGLNLVLTFTPLVSHTYVEPPDQHCFENRMAVYGKHLRCCLPRAQEHTIGFLTSWSYDRLNVLHQIVGYTAMAQCIIHASAYSSYFIALGNMARLRVAEEIYGMVAGFTMLTMVIVAFAIRRRCYEIFYGIHISFFIITMIFLGFHQPESSTRMIYAVIAACGIWVLDRIIRILRLVMYSVNNSVAVHPLPHGGTRITLHKAPAGAWSGKHCFIWIPRIRTWEMHPFTIANMDPLEFVWHPTMASREIYTNMRLPTLARH